MQQKRADLERNEDIILAPYAMRSANSRGRDHKEANSKTRTAFQRDRDRIIHTTAFRRLEYKTQVFVNNEGDHYRTRLTHTLEVAQLGRSIARGLGANEDLTEAICLAHDLGHPPFGHAGEATLNKLTQASLGGFNHNTQSLRIVTYLERRYPNFNGLNLTYETREGMIKHETVYDKSDASGYDPDKRGFVEAQIANMADPIAYDSHDLDDGLRAGMFSPDDLAHLAIWQELRERVGWTTGNFTLMIQHQMIRELVGMLVTNVVQTSSAKLEGLRLDSPEKVQLHHENVIGFSADLAPKVKALKTFLYARMYRHYRLMRMTSKAEKFITELYNAYINESRMLPTRTQARLEEDDLAQVVTDYIAGMTDRYALDEWSRLFDPETRV